MFSRLKTFFTHPGDRFRAPSRIFWTGLIVRVLYITLARSYRVKPILDHFQFGWELGRIARALATGYGYADPFMGHTGPTAWIPPLYTLMLAGVFKLFGVYTPFSAWMILTINSIFSAGIALAVYEIAARCYDANGHGRRVALWSAWLWALYPAAIQYAVHWIWDMSLTTFLFAWVLVVSLRVRNVGEAPGISGQKTSLWALFGLLWGLIALSNPSLLLVLPACAIWMLWPARRPLPTLAAAGAKALLAALIFAACLTPWVWRNWIAFHAFIPTRSNLGAELYVSTLEEKDGFTWGAVVPLSESHPDFLRYKSLGEIAYCREKGTLAMVNIHRHPRRIAGWMLKRFYFYWASVPHPFEKSPLIEYAREINFGFFSVSGILGLLLSIRRRVPAAWLFAAIFLFQPLLYYAITVQSRFRHPLEPLIDIFTVFLFQSAERSRRKSSVPAETTLAEA
jgi:hypothetical protein